VPASGCKVKNARAAVPDTAAAESATGAELAAAPDAAANAPAVAPPDPIHDALWAVAAMVAEGASTHVAPPSAVGPTPLPFAAPRPSPDPVPLAPTLAPAKFPAFMVELHHAPDPVQWAVFGGTAAFLGVIWVAIWLAVGK